MTNEEIEQKADRVVSELRDLFMDGFDSDDRRLCVESISRVIREAVVQAYEEAAQEVAEFDDWVWCECSECKLDARSHAVNTDGSLEVLAANISALKDVLP